MGEEFDECCRAYEAANQGIFQSPYLIKCRYKDTGAFLGGVSIRGLFDRLPQFDGQLETITPERIKEIFFEVRKEGIEMGIQWKLWPHMYKRLKGVGNHARIVESTCKQHPKWQELLKMTGSFWSNTLSQLGRRDVKHKDKRNEVIKHFLELIQAGKVDEATLYLTNSATDLLACSAGYV